VALNCAALPESIVETELFGHAKGAFTGAVAAKKGLFAAADGGTLFLDEIGELSLATQAKLLRVIEGGEVTPVGSVQSKRVAVRILAATNRDLQSLVEAGRFREDLYFRIQGMTLHIPPLRERTEDLAPLVEFFAAAVARQLGRPAPRFDATAMAAMETYPWRGNVRELRNVVERAVTLAREASVLGANDIRLRSEARQAPSPAAATLPPSSDGDPGDRDRLVAALGRAAGNQTVAAKLLGVSRRTLIRRMEEHAIGRPRKGVKA
jgi:two-component system, NtrC family, response regulator AtoC